MTTIGMTDHPRLNELREKLPSILERVGLAGEKVPLHLMRVPYPNAAMRRDRNQRPRRIEISLGMLDEFSTEEVEAILLHELYHWQDRPGTSKDRELAADLFAAQHGYSEPSITALSRVRPGESFNHPDWRERVNALRDWQRSRVEESLWKVARQVDYRGPGLRVELQPEWSSHLLGVTLTPYPRLLSASVNVDKLPEEHMEAWIAHELGHVVLRHVYTPPFEYHSLPPEDRYEREFSADLFAAEHGYREHLIQTLRTAPVHLHVPDSPTHPRPEQRIERLQSRTGR